MFVRNGGMLKGSRLVGFGCLARLALVYMGSTRLTGLNTRVTMVLALTCRGILTVVGWNLRGRLALMLRLPKWNCFRRKWKRKCRLLKNRVFFTGLVPFVVMVVIIVKVSLRLTAFVSR